MTVLTLPEAEAMAERVLARLEQRDGHPAWDRVRDADRERVAADLAVIRRVWDEDGPAYVMGYATANLARTARLYGQETP